MSELADALGMLGAIAVSEFERISETGVLCDQFCCVVDGSSGQAATEKRDRVDAVQDQPILCSNVAF